MFARSAMATPEVRRLWQGRVAAPPHLVYSTLPRDWCERIRTLPATCAEQGRSAFAFLVDSLAAHFRRQPPPLLLPAKL